LTVVDFPFQVEKGWASMRYKSFRIQNFKGIKDTTVNLGGIAGASVFAFVGLNESGKTTLLEAIHSFSPDASTSDLIDETEELRVPFKTRVPRHLISSFTGYVSVEATLSVTEDDKKNILEGLAKTHDFEINKSEFPSEIVLERQQKFENGDFKANYFALKSAFQIRSKKQQRWREPTVEEQVAIRDQIYSSAPDIAYFPTFVFDFPDAIFLTDRGGILDEFYRGVFQDVLDFDGRGHTIEKDIVRRVRDQGMVVPWLSFMSAWLQHDDRSKIQHVVDRASATVTRVVFGRWNKIFGEDGRAQVAVACGNRVIDRGVQLGRVFFAQ
jgi:hypothetical protein